RDHKILERHILVANSGELRSSSKATHKYIQSFLRGNNIKEWLTIKCATRDFARAIAVGKWQKAAAAAYRESLLRDRIVDNLWTPITAALRKAAEEHECFPRIAGGNQGGCVWAMGAPRCIAALEKKWATILKCKNQGGLLTNQIAATGLVVTCN